LLLPPRPLLPLRTNGWSTDMLAVVLPPRLRLLLLLRSPVLRPLLAPAVVAADAALPLPLLQPLL
jgi:hypothetical protein